MLGGEDKETSGGKDDLRMGERFLLSEGSGL